MALTLDPVASIDADLRASQALVFETAALLDDAVAEVVRLLIRADTLNMRFDVLLDRRNAATVTACA